MKTNKIIKALGVAVLLVGIILSHSERAYTTVSNTVTQTVTANGNGVTTNYTIGFDFRDNTWVTVTLVDSSTGSTNVSNGAGAGKFTITGGNPGTTVVMGTAPTSTQYLVIGRSIPLTQPVSYDEASAFPASDHESQMDRMMMEIQNLEFGVQGGIQSVAAVAHQWINSISSSGLPLLSQPAYSDISGTTLPSAVQGNITTLGTITSGTWNGTTLDAAYGGTSQSTWTLGDLLYSSASNTLAKLAGNITSTKKFLSQTGTGAVSAAPSWIQPACADLSNASASCSTDATNASNVSSGTLSAGRMPALTGDVTSSSGTVATTVAKIQGTTVSGITGSGNVVFATSPQLGASIGIGTAATGGVGVALSGSLSSVANSVGIQESQTHNASSTVINILSSPNTANSSTPTSVAGVQIQDVSKGTSSTVGTQYGLRVTALSSATTNYSIFTAAGLVSIGDTTDSSSSSTGSIVTSGGVGIAKSLQVGTTAGISGLITASNGVSIAGGSEAAGKIVYSASDGLAVNAKAGSVTDFVLLSASGNSIIQNATGTQNLSFNATGGGTSNFSNNVGIAGGVSSLALLNLNGGTNPLTGSTQIGIFNQLTGTSAATVAIRGMQSSITTAANTTVGTVINYLAGGVTKGASGTITRAIDLQVNTASGAPGTNNASIADNTAFTGNWFLNQSGTEPSTFAGAVTMASGVKVTNLLLSQTAPTISSGFGSSPTIAANNGTAAFTINVGTGGTATNGTVGLPTATTGWACECNDIVNTSSTIFLCKQIGGTTTTAQFANYNTSGVQAAWAGSDVLRVSCFAY